MGEKLGQETFCRLRQRYGASDRAPEEIQGDVREKQEEGSEVFPKSRGTGEAGGSLAFLYMVEIRLLI